jgi:hypothetical protein
MVTEMEMETEAEAEAAAVVMTRMMETAKTVKGVAETVANWEVGQIMGADGEGTMSDDDGTGMEVTAEGSCL